ncbi:MAG: SAM-dependent methyltransferase, partial [Archaeoglobaceae archaeon]
MLTLIGLGLGDEKDITIRGLEAVKDADVVYAEFYTSKIFASLEALRKFLGKEIRLLSRE